MKSLSTFLFFSTLFLLIGCAATLNGVKDSLANYAEPSSGATARLRVISKPAFFNGGGAVRVYANTPCLPNRLQKGDGILFSTGLALLSPDNGNKKISDESVIPKGYKYTEVNIVAGKPLTLHLLWGDAMLTEAYTFFPNEGRTYVLDSTAGLIYSPRLKIVGVKGEMMGYSNTGACAN